MKSLKVLFPIIIFSLNVIILKSQVIDTTSPVITLIGNSIVTICKGGTFEDPGVMVIDDHDSNPVINTSGTYFTDYLLYFQIGLYSIEYQAVDSAGNYSQQLTRLVYVTQMLFVMVNTKSGKDTLCRTEGLIELDGQPSGTGGVWTGPGIQGNYFNTLIGAEIESPYTINYKYTDSKGCTDNANLILMVRPEPTVMINSTSYVLCFGNPYSIKASYKNADGVLWYKDNNKADGSFIGVVSDTIVSYLPGLGDLARLHFWLNIRTTHNDNVCPTAYDSIQVNMSDLPIPDFSVAGSIPLTVQFYDNSTIGIGKIDKYYWEFGDSGTSTMHEPLYTYAGPGVYWVKLCITSDAGCDSCIKKELWINDKWGVSIPEINSTTRLIIKPIPADNQVIINFDNSNCQIESVYLFNSFGQVIRNYKTITNGQLNIKREGLASGLYFIKVYPETGKAIHGKVIFE